MVWKKAKRFLAGLCTVAMLTQSVFDSTIFVAAAGSTPEAAVETSVEAAVSGGEAVVAADAVSDSDAAVDADADDVSSADAAVAQDDAKQTVSVNDADSTEDVSVSDAEETLVPQVDEPEEQVALGGWISSGGTQYLYSGTTLYATLTADGTLTISKDADILHPDNFFFGWDGKGSTDKDEAKALQEEAKAFKNSIRKLQFAEGATAYGIAEKCFSECANLSSIDLTNAHEMTTINPNAFEKCISLTEIKFNEELQFIQSKAFTGCTALGHVTFTAGLIRLEESVFEGCSSLESIRIEASNMACKTKGGGNATNIFKGCNLKSFDLAAKAAEASESGNNIIIPPYLFNGAGFASDATIVIPYDIQEISEGAFQNSNIVSIEFQNSAAKPSALSVIGKNAFSGCKALAAVEFHTTLQTIEEGAFQTCTALQKVVIPNSVNKIGTRAFQGCIGITSLTLSNGTTTEGALGDNLFEGCTALTAVEIPSGTYIGNSEFAKCTKLYKVTIPDSISDIGKSAFSECTSLVTILLPTSITEIKDGTFNKCSNLVTAKVPEGVTKIGSNAFYECVNLQSNDFPVSLKEIGNSAYYKCLSFKNITLPENLEKLGTTVFKECQYVNTVTLQSQKITSCGTAVFNGCWLRNLVFPEGITTIPANLFNQATFITDVTITIPATVTTIGSGAFGGTKASEVNVTKFVFEEGSQLQVIGASAFTYCTAITSFTIPETTTEIGASAFEACNKLESIIIPENVTKIGAGAFKSCSILSNIVFNAIAVTSSNENIFAACNVKSITIGPKVTISRRSSLREHSSPSIRTPERWNISILRSRQQWRRSVSMHCLPSPICSR